MTRRAMGGQDGMVTAEIAVALPVLTMLLAAALTAVTAVTAQMRCVDAAREAARALARGDSVATARDLVRQVGPSGARLSVTRSGDEVRVSVAARSARLGGLVPGVGLHARTVALREPGTVGAP